MKVEERAQEILGGYRGCAGDFAKFRRFSCSRRHLANASGSTRTERTMTKLDAKLTQIEQRSAERNTPPPSCPARLIRFRRGYGVTGLLRQR